MTSQGDDFGDGVHDGTVHSDWQAHDVLGGSVNDGHAVLALLQDADVFVRLQSHILEFDALLADA